MKTQSPCEKFEGEFFMSKSIHQVKPLKANRRLSQGNGSNLVDFNLGGGMSDLNCSIGRTICQEKEKAKTGDWILQSQGMKEKKQDRIFTSLWPWVVILALILLGLIGGCGIAGAEVINVDKLADAIYRAENSVKYPYGIKSINTHGDEAYARKICLNTIRNNMVRFSKQNKYSDFITFLGSRYCPPSAHSLNKHWVTNVKYFYGRG